MATYVDMESCDRRGGDHVDTIVNTRYRERSGYCLDCGWWYKAVTSVEEGQATLEEVNEWRMNYNHLPPLKTLRKPQQGNGRG